LLEKRYILKTLVFLIKKLVFFELRLFIKAFIRQKTLDVSVKSYFDIGTIIGMPSNSNELAYDAIRYYSRPDVLNEINTTGDISSIEKGIAYMTSYYKSFCSPPKEMSSSENDNNINSIW